MRKQQAKPQSLPATTLGNEWLELCGRFLPVSRANSIWRFSHATRADGPEQGWKLHVSATVLTACSVLRSIAPLLHGRGVYFKAPMSLEEVKRINSGLYYGYSQVGKLITIYPKTTSEAAELAQQLYQLTGTVAAPTVPFDQRFRPGGCVYYRYGAFRRMEVENPNGTRFLALRDPEGRLSPDLRDSVGSKPGWITESLDEAQQYAHEQSTNSPLNNTYRVFRALSQRGKGGVYQALDLSTDPARLCVLKEGRRNGELSWDGRDGSWRSRNEERVLRSLTAAVKEVPLVYGSFELEGNYYLVTEFMEGETLQAYLLRRQRRITIGQGLSLGAQLASMLVRIHRAGWIWRDCKPGNLMLTKEGTLRPLDFEGACRRNEPDPLPWGTPGFTSANGSYRIESSANGDLYGLGATLYFVFTGRLPLASSPLPITKYRNGVPAHICDLILKSLTGNSRCRLSVKTVRQQLRQALASPATSPGSRLRAARSLPHRS